MFVKITRILLPLSVTVPETRNCPATMNVDMPKTDHPGSNELHATTTVNSLTSMTPIQSDVGTTGTLLQFTCFTYITSSVKLYYNN